ncbi:LrgB family protein [Limibaculum sp. M0105]|uniref:LrgB family protein n=1 Tax=Thermohalobaculum xanthum TaxID=2753746 RepID=A0A8J7SDF7_9RHOB|nr:LrgB family protein [Thermohalobaculum xanthum]MBK0400037.1 LrgB family protein [Thermohalobaculum xanthum]
MTEGMRDVWVYLAREPLVHLTLTLAAFQLGSWIYRRGGMNPLLNPVLIAVALTVGGLVLTGTSYDAYFEGAQFVHFLLGPATVALAIPLYRQVEKVRRSALALGASIVAGALAASASAVGIAWSLGASRDALISVAPKSVTAPVAMGITESLGGLPSLTAVLVILTGIVGAMLGPWVLTLVGVRDWRARGLAIGTASHGIGTARALQVNEVAGAFAGLAMGLNALATALLLPLLARIFL